MLLRGIVLIALGHDLYGKNAYNLALSIKAHNDIRVCLLYDNKAVSNLGQKDLEIFDDKVLFNYEDCTVNGQIQYQRAKLCVYDYSPYDFTIYMDADSLWLPGKKIDDLDIYKRDFTIGMYGEYTGNRTQNGYMFWGDPIVICNYFDIEYLPQTISGFFAFKKNKTTKLLFDVAKYVYDDEKAPAMKWANGKADEYCFNVAMAKIGMRQEKFNVFYFEKINKGLSNEQIYDNYFGIAMGTHKVSENLVIIYNKLVNLYCQQKGITKRFYHIDKKEVIPERKTF